MEIDNDYKYLKELKRDKQILITKILKQRQNKQIIPAHIFIRLSFIIKYINWIQKSIESEFKTIKYHSSKLIIC